MKLYKTLFNVIICHDYIIISFDRSFSTPSATIMTTRESGFSPVYNDAVFNIRNWQAVQLTTRDLIVVSERTSRYLWPWGKRTRRRPVDWFTLRLSSQYI